MQLTSDEVTPGLVVLLDTATLRTAGGAQTNAVRDVHGDRAVVGPHDFLIVGVVVGDHDDAARGTDGSHTHCAAVPLFPKSAVGNQPLLNALKSGGANDWRTADTYFSHWQHWRVPIASLLEASSQDVTTPATRRRYAADDRQALDDVRAWETRNRAEYRDA